MILCIAGSRTLFPSPEDIDLYVSQCPWEEPVTEVLSGGAKGVDTSAIEYAKGIGMQYTVMYPGWVQHGRFYAGFVRNNKMAHYADALLAIWDGKSKGTKHMIESMKEIGKPVHVVYAGTG